MTEIHTAEQVGKGNEEQKDTGEIISEQSWETWLQHSEQMQCRVSAMF